MECDQGAWGPMLVVIKYGTMMMMKKEEIDTGSRSKSKSIINQVKGRNFSRTCAIEGGRLRFIVVEYALLAAIDEDARDDEEILLQE